MSRITCAVALLALVGTVHTGIGTAATYRFDKAWGEYGTANGLFNGPMRINIQGNNLLVGDRDNDRVQMFDLEGRFLRKFGTQGYGRDNLRNPFDADFDASGNIYIADFGNGRIQKRTSTFGFLSMWGSDGTGVHQFQGPRGVAVDRTNGILYVADTLNNRIDKYTVNGVYIGYFGKSGTGEGQFNSPYDVAVGPSGVYVADTENNRIQQFALSGRYIRQWNRSAGGTTLRWPPAVAVAPDGSVFVCDGENNRVVKYSATGGVLTSFGRYGPGPGDFDMPGGIAVDAAGRVYVSNSHAHRIQRYVLDLNRPPARPTNLSIIPVVPRDSNQLTARASGSTDPDGSAVSYKFQWQASPDGLNWTTIYKQRVLPAAQTQAGSWYRFRACATDGALSSAWVTSQKVRVLAGTAPLTAASACQAAGGAIALTVGLGEGGTVEAQVLNLAGRVVATVPPVSLDAGTATISVNPISTHGTRLPAGSYMVKITMHSGSGESTSVTTPLMLRARQGS
jgi:DNA-binding beta-propeller fold protein YncE